MYTGNRIATTIRKLSITAKTASTLRPSSPWSRIPDLVWLCPIIHRTQLVQKGIRLIWLKYDGADRFRMKNRLNLVSASKYWKKAANPWQISAHRCARHVIDAMCYCQLPAFVESTDRSACVRIVLIVWRKCRKATSNPISSVFWTAMSSEYVALQKKLSLHARRGLSVGSY